MYAFFTLPTPDTVLASTTEWSGPFFTALLPIALVLTGIAVGALLVIFLKDGIIDAFHWLALGREGRQNAREWRDRE